MRIIIAGSRDFEDYLFLKNKCTMIIETLYNDYYKHNLIKSFEDLKITIISGNAKGADRLGEKFAQEHKFDLVTFFAEWDLYGKSAGYMRNIEMAKYAKNEDGVLIAFWNGKSHGTKHMINISKNYGLTTFIYKV